MYERVNPAHPDKVADRIAGAIVDYCYAVEENPKVAIDVMIGHHQCKIMGECSIPLASEPHNEKVYGIIYRITGEFQYAELMIAEQDKHLSDNQKDGFRCGDNGIFKGVPANHEERMLSSFMAFLYKKFPSDGKAIYDKHSGTLVLCQSNASKKELLDEANRSFGNEKFIVNPLGDWTGGLSVDTGCTNRKLGSDMGRAVTGAGLHGKDLTKSDVSVNIVCHLLAEQRQCEVSAFCAIGDEKVEFVCSKPDLRIERKTMSEIISMAKAYVEELGGFEKLAEWGLI